jgi:hypothetical protein
MERPQIAARAGRSTKLSAAAKATPTRSAVPRMRVPHISPRFFCGEIWGTHARGGARNIHGSICDARHYRGVAVTVTEPNLSVE